jgi:hypothetical protein
MGHRARLAQRDLTEKMIHKLRAGMMPPSGARRPAPDQISKMVTALETRMDALAAERSRIRAGVRSSD